MVKLCLKCHKINHRYGPLSKSKRLPEKYHLIPIMIEEKQMGELIVSAELPDDIRFSPNFPDEPEITIGHFKANLSKTAKMVSK